MNYMSLCSISDNSEESILIHIVISYDLIHPVNYLCLSICIYLCIPVNTALKI